VIVQQDYAQNHSDKFEHKIINQAKMNDKGMAVFKDRLDSQLSLLDGAQSDEATREVEVTFTYYRMRHGATRALFGAMAGTDNITSTVIIRDRKGGKVLGKIKVVSKNATAIGTTRGLIEDHADKIINFIRSSKS